VKFAKVEVCIVVGKLEVGKSDLDGEESAEELAEEGNNVDTGEPGSRESESGERESREIAEEPAAEGNGIDAAEPAATEPAAAEPAAAEPAAAEPAAAEYKTTV